MTSSPRLPAPRRARPTRSASGLHGLGGAAALAVGLGSSTFGAAGCEELPRTYSTRSADATILVRDDFGRAELGNAWAPSGAGATIVDGALHVENLRNHPLWLRTPLPDNVRIEFDAWALTEEGDVKVELAGDGVSFATSANYVATGYVVIFGGWNNSLDAIVRQREHGRDRATARSATVEPGRRYHWVISRTLTERGAELRWEVDGREILTYDDPAPLIGEGHRHFAFGGWEAAVRFDNLVIEAL